MNATPPTPTRRGLAFLLTALGPGFGQLYARDYAGAFKALAWWMLASAAPGVLAPHVLGLGRWVLPVSALWMLAVWWAIALHAAAGVGLRFVPRRRSLELLFVAAWVGMWGGQSLIRSHIGGPVATLGQSMAPSLGAGELFYASRADLPLERGQIVLVSGERGERLGRVVAGPGERVAMRQGVLAVDGSSVVSKRSDVQWWAEGCRSAQQHLPFESHGSLQVPVVPGPQSGSGEERLLGPDQWLVVPDDRRALQELPEPIRPGEVTGTVLGPMAWTNPCGIGPLRALWPR